MNFMQEFDVYQKKIHFFFLLSKMGFKFLLVAMLAFTSAFPSSSSQKISTSIPESTLNTSPSSPPKMEKRCDEGVFNALLLREEKLLWSGDIKEKTRIYKKIVNLKLACAGPIPSDR
jgi:hypothetical protein